MRRRSTHCIAVSFLLPVVEVPSWKSEEVLFWMRGSRFGIFGGLPGPFKLGVEEYFLIAVPCSPSFILEYGSVPLSEESLGVAMACFANLPGSVSVTVGEVILKLALIPEARDTIAEHALSVPLVVLVHALVKEVRIFFFDQVIDFVIGLAAVISGFRCYAAQPLRGFPRRPPSLPEQSLTQVADVVALQFQRNEPSATR